MTTATSHDHRDARSDHEATHQRSAPREQDLPSQAEVDPLGLENDEETLGRDGAWHLASRAGLDSQAGAQMPVLSAGPRVPASGGAGGLALAVELAELDVAGFIY